MDVFQLNFFPLHSIFQVCLTYLNQYRFYEYHESVEFSSIKGNKISVFLKKLFNNENFKKLTESHVVICGLGAVGSYAAEALARAGVGNLRLVDFDTIDETNINRQLYALHSTVNSSKISVAEKRIRDINPECHLDLRQVFINEDTVHDILEKPAEILIDAIDSVSSKIHLIKHAVRKNLHVVSCMGAAGRLDANLITTGDISESHTCPLARIIRRRLHRHDIYDGVFFFNICNFIYKFSKIPFKTYE